MKTDGNQGEVAKRIGDWEWTRACCTNAADANKKPVVSVVLRLGTDGQSMTIEVKATHVCGIETLDYEFVISPRGPERSFHKRGRTIDGGFGANDPAYNPQDQDKKWEFGPGKPDGNLPRSLFDATVYVFVTAISACGTGTADSAVGGVF